jgi:hypothetical protein
MAELRDLSREERSLLLFVETCAVDHAGAMSSKHLSSDDQKLLDRWNETGFVQSGRICFKDAERIKRGQWCELSEDAWLLSRQERRERAERLLSSRRWHRTVEEGRDGH